MANLTYRAERALLGALLRDPDLLEDVRFLTAADFVSQVHRDIFSAIGSVQAAQTAETPRSYVRAVTLAAPGPGTDIRYLEDTARACPEPANAMAYARMVMEASLRRRLLAQANRLLQDAGNLHWEVGRFSQAAGSDHGIDNFPSHLMKLAHAMWVHAKGFAPGSPGDSTRPSAGEPDEITVAGPQSDRSVSRQALGDADATQGEEEEVLADLIQHHWQNSDVLRWLPADAFAPGPRREIYQAIAGLARNGDPVDALTVEWQMARQHAARQSVAPSPSNAADQTEGPGGGPGYVGVLAGLPVADGTATLTGRVLLNRHAAAQLDAVARQLPEAPGRDAAARAPIVSGSWPRRGQESTQSSSKVNRPPSAPLPPPSFGATPDSPTRPDLLQPPPGSTGQPSQRGPQPRH